MDFPAWRCPPSCRLLPAGTSMTVHVLADNSAKISTIRALLGSKFDVTAELLGSAEVAARKLEALIVDVDLRRVENLSIVKALSDRLLRIPRRIFILDEP